MEDSDSTSDKAKIEEVLTIEQGLCVRCMHIDSFDDESKRGVRIDQYLLEKGGGYDKIKNTEVKSWKNFNDEKRFYWR